MSWEKDRQVDNGRYQIVYRIGTGGFGITYKAIDLKAHTPNTIVAIKTLNEKRQRQTNFKQLQVNFLNEAMALAKCSHPHVIRVDRVFQEDEIWAMVMEYVEGKSLEDYLIEHRKLPETQAVEILQKVGSAVSYVHTRKLLHRDIKPANILLRENGEPVLIDFGLAREFVAGIAKSMTSDRTPHYSPPEQAERRGEFQPSLDIYALAATLYTCVTGDLPPLAEIRMVRDSLIPPQQVDPELSDRVNQAVLIGMALKPEERSRTVEEWLSIMAEEPSQPIKNNEINQTSQTEPPEVEGIEKSEQENPISERTTPQTKPREAKQPVQPEPAEVEAIEHSEQENPIPARTTVGKGKSMNRRMILQWLGWGGVGLVGSIVWAIMPRSNVDSSLSLNEQFQPIFDETKNLVGSILTIKFKTVKLDIRGMIVDRPMATAQMYREDLGNGVSLTMMRIPAGSFEMGSAAHWDRELVPQHRVTVKAFYMGQTKVTQTQYQALMGENPSKFKGNNRPVESISWERAQEFCKRLSAKTGKNYSLPSESQWEYACRAGTTTLFYFGDRITTDVANINGYSDAYGPTGVYREETTDVGIFPPNAFGLYDMHGNVSEWCEDTWHDNYQGAPTDGSAWVSGGKDNVHLTRGGSWHYPSDSCRCASRQLASFYIDFEGFRVIHL